MADTLRALHAKQGAVKFLGSYPAAGEHAHSAREHADARWRSADDWVTELRRSGDQPSSIERERQTEPEHTGQARRRTGEVAGGGQQLGQHGDEQRARRRRPTRRPRDRRSRVEEAVDGERDQAAQHERPSHSSVTGTGPVGRPLGSARSRRSADGAPHRKTATITAAPIPCPASRLPTMMIASHPTSRAAPVAAVLGTDVSAADPAVAADHVRGHCAGGQSDGGPPAPSDEAPGLLDELVGDGAEQGAAPRPSTRPTSRGAGRWSASNPPRTNEAPATIPKTRRRTPAGMLRPASTATSPRRPESIWAAILPEPDLGAIFPTVAKKHAGSVCGSGHPSASALTPSNVRSMLARCSRSR